MVWGKGPFGLSSQGDGAMPRTTRRASTSRALPPFFKNRFNQVPSVTEYPLIKRIRTDTTIDLSKILPRRVTLHMRCHFSTNQPSRPLCAPDLLCVQMEYLLSNACLRVSFATFVYKNESTCLHVYILYEQQQQQQQP